VHRAKRMLEPGMKRARVYKVGKAELFDMTEPLKVRVGDDVEQQLAFDGYETIDRVVDDLIFIQGLALFLCNLGLIVPFANG
jgi:hypothetical protein